MGYHSPKKESFVNSLVIHVPKEVEPILKRPVNHFAIEKADNTIKGTT